MKWEGEVFGPTSAEALLSSYCILLRGFTFQACCSLKES
jgi:hypothetical protein